MQEIEQYPLPEPLGFTYRTHENGVLIKDGGRITTLASVITGDEPATYLYSAIQMQEAYEAGIKRGSDV